MSRVKELNIIYHQGDTFDDLRIAYEDESGNALSLAGFTVSMKVKTLDGLTTAVSIDSSSIGGIVVATPTSGIIDFDATPAMMSGALPLVKYVYDVQITDGTKIKTLLKGSFSVDSEVTT